MKPFLVKEIDNPDGSIYKKTEPKEVGQPINAGTAEAISKFMGEEVSIGGGQSAKIEGYRFGGKTGTAQKKTEDSTGYADGQYVGSFIGFGPLEDPRFLVLIVVDDEPEASRPCRHDTGPHHSARPYFQRRRPHAVLYRLEYEGSQ